MAKPIEANWELAKALVVQGMTVKDAAVKIGVSVGCLQKRAWRHNWTGTRRAAAGIIEAAGVEAPESAEKRLRAKLQADAEAVVDRLAELSPGRLGIERLEVRERVAASVHKRVWSCLGLDQVNRSVSVDIAVMSVLGDAEPAYKISQVVDVQSVAPSEYNTHCATTNSEPLDTQQVTESEEPS